MIPENNKDRASKKVIVIGAGAAGLSAAVAALRNGANVQVLEHKEEPGKKLLITGNGCCNFSNTDLSEAHYHGDESLIRSVLQKFGLKEMIDYFKSLGINSIPEYYRFENCGYLYPESRKAIDVRDAFVREIIRKNGSIHCGEEIVSVETRSLEGKGRFTVRTTRGNYIADALIFATGSNAAPITGSDSSIYPVLHSLKIEILPWKPALCAVKSPDPRLRLLAGYRCDGSAELIDETTGEIFQSPSGEIQFREHYISGFPVMQLSRFVPEALAKFHRMQLKLSLQTANNKDRKLLFENLSLPVSGTEGFERCICCSGGISGELIDPETLQCKRLPGVYFAGELLNVDGDCGGFNLHYAFASGYLAGRNAAL